MKMLFILGITDIKFRQFSKSILHSRTNEKRPKVQRWCQITACDWFFRSLNLHAVIRLTFSTEYSTRDPECNASISRAYLNMKIYMPQFCHGAEYNKSSHGITPKTAYSLLICAYSPHLKWTSGFVPHPFQLCVHLYHGCFAEMVISNE